MSEYSAAIDSLLKTSISTNLGSAREELYENQPLVRQSQNIEFIKLLRRAVSSGDSNKVHEILRSSASLHSESVSDMPLICTAASRGFTDIIGLLIRHGANVDLQSSEGSTALIYTADGGHVTALSLLLNAGALMNITNRNGETALTRATRRGWVHCARLLLGYGANPHPMPSDGHTFVVSPLHLARQMHQTAIETEILSRAQSIDKTLTDVVTATLPKYLILMEPGHLTDNKSMSFFPVQLITSRELDRFVLYFKTPPSYGLVCQSTQNSSQSASGSTGSTPSDELILVFVVRVQLIDNQVSCWLNGPPFDSLGLSFNGSRKCCSHIPLPLEYPGICVYSVATPIRSGGLNTLCLDCRAKPSYEATDLLSEKDINRSMVLVGAYRVRIDVTSLIKTSTSPTKPTVYIPRSIFG